MIIGIAGYMGSGKTTAAKYFSHTGAVVIDADTVAKELMNTTAAIQDNISKTFGKEAVSDGKVVFPYLRSKAYQSSANMLKLNKIVHPALLEKLEEKICRAPDKNRLVLDAALISYWKIEEWFDVLYWIESSFEIRKHRLTLKLGLTAQEVTERMTLQEQMVQKPQGAMWKVIRNDGSVEQFEKTLSIADRETIA
jgi:dephospho-CoA kinase